jgi:hypothetical protein
MNVLKNVLYVSEVLGISFVIKGSPGERCIEIARRARFICDLSEKLWEEKEYNLQRDCVDKAIALSHYWDSHSRYSSVYVDEIMKKISV